MVGCIFLMAKRYFMLMRLQAAKTWMRVPHEPPADSVAGKTVGIVGTGAIGQEVAWRCDALGMRVLGLRRTPAPLPHFREVVGPAGLPLLREADFLVLAAPLTSETRGLLGASELRQMKRSAYLINVGRGALTVEADLVRALRERWIAGACLDVFEQEPLGRIVDFTDRRHRGSVRLKRRAEWARRESKWQATPPRPATPRLTA